MKFPPRAMSFDLLRVCLLLEAGVASPDPFNEGELAAVVWENAPDVIAARREVIEADAVRDRSLLLPNPTLITDWTTIPLGPRTGGAAFWEVPSYTVGVSALLEIGKRGPRQEAAAAARRSTRLAAHDAYRQSFFAVLEALSNVAAATVRTAVLRRLVSSSDESLRLQRARAGRGDVASLEVDRLRVEHVRLESSLRGTEAEQAAARLACTRILGLECPPFPTEEEADRFLHRTIVPSATEAVAALGDRPDLLALGAEDLRLRSEHVLARRLRIPDLTVGVAYTHDQFVLAGNQANSVSLVMSLPLPFFDRGQSDVRRVESRIALNARLLKTVSTIARTAIEIGHRQLAALQERARALDSEALPQARDVVARTEAAAQRGGAALPDVLLVRRTLEELALDRVDVLAAVHRAALDLRRAAGDFPQPRSSW